MMSNRLVLGAITLEEAQEISENNSTATVNEYLESLSKDEVSKIMDDREGFQNIIRRLGMLLNTEQYALYGGWLNHKLIGYVSLVICDEIPELQIEVLPEYQGKGLGYELLEKVKRSIFEVREYPYLKYVVIPSNQSSIALVEKLGGVLQESESYAEGRLLKIYHLYRN